MIYQCFTSYKKGYHSGFYEQGAKCPYSRFHPKGKSWLKGHKAGAAYRAKRNSDYDLQNLPTRRQATSNA